MPYALITWIPNVIGIGFIVLTGIEVSEYFSLEDIDTASCNETMATFISIMLIAECVEFVIEWIYHINHAQFAIEYKDDDSSVSFAEKYNKLEIYYIFFLLAKKECGKQKVTRSTLR